VTGDAVGQYEALNADRVGSGVITGHESPGRTPLAFGALVLIRDGSRAEKHRLAPVRVRGPWTENCAAVSSPEGVRRPLPYGGPG